MPPITKRLEEAVKRHGASLPQPGRERLERIRALAQEMLERGIIQKKSYPFPSPQQTEKLFEERLSAASRNQGFRSSWEE